MCDEGKGCVISKCVVFEVDLLSRMAADTDTPEWVRSYSQLESKEDVAHLLPRYVTFSYK